MIRSSLFGRCLSLSVVAAVAVSGGCTSTKPRTQVMLVVEADQEVQMQATSLRVEIEGRPLGTEMYSLTSDTTYPPPDSDVMMWPYSFALIPRGGEINREFRITATAYSGADAIARLRAESGFVSAKTLELKLRFQKSCLHAASLDCDPTQTCLDGYCVPARIDQTMLPTFTGEPEVIIPVGDGGQGTTSNPVSTAGAGGAAGSGMATGTGGAGGAGGDPSMPGNCGDGKITGDEKCDIAIPDGMAGACPKECLKASACERSQLEGTGCQTRCTPSTITEFDSGDGCCPEGADANSDTDCRSSCGNGSIEAGEACDPVEMCPTAVTCVSLNACLKAVVLGDAAACTAQCNMQPIVDCMSGDGCCPSTCTNATDSDCSASCGNGTIEAGEVCEPNSAQMPCPTTCDDGNACTTDLLTGSANNCNSACTNVPIAAPKNDDGCCPSGANANNDNDCDPICGNRIVEAGERCDGRCPTAATCGDLFACTRDGIMGSGCSVQCTHDVILTPAANDGCCPVGANQTNDNDCQPVCGNGVKERGEGCDGVLPASGGCPTEASCNDNNPCTNDGVAGSACNLACTHQRLTSTTPVDGTNCCRDGERVACGPVCGNGRRESGEGCDDGNTRNGDGCSSTCQEEPPPASCGDGSVNQANEQCDDGNTTSGDGCSANCKAEPKCGDSVKNGTEICDPPGAPCPSCDDNDECTGDVIGGTDACHPTCSHPSLSGMKDGVCCPKGATSTADPDCPAPGPMCGNGVKEGNELCDPPEAPCPPCDDSDECTGDVVGGPDDCHPTCNHPPLSGMKDGLCCPKGSTTTTDPDCPPPAPMCGNGIKEGNEVCDPPGAPCPSCSDNDECTDDVVGGSDACHPTCSHPSLNGVLDGKCCPSGGTSTDDPDCPPPT